MTKRTCDSSYELFKQYPELQEHLPVCNLAQLATPLHSEMLRSDGHKQPIWIKADDGPGRGYGGNKLRKLDFLFGQLGQRRIQRVATFGTVASNHALATAACARLLGIEAVCFLAHQTRTPLAARALSLHATLKTKIVPWLGNRQERINLLRENLWHRDAAVIATGGSSWTGTVGFVNAGLELAAQLAIQRSLPARVYVASGTLGSAAGLALGLALAECETEVHAVRVSPTSLCNHTVLQRLMAKTAAMLHRLDANIDADGYRRARIVLRHDQFGPGYAKPANETHRAIETARRECGLELEPTYTGKAFAALLDDFSDKRIRDAGQLFWNTYYPIPRGAKETLDGLPLSFASYLGDI